MLKTAGGYLLILQTLEDAPSSPERCISLLYQATLAQDWDLCKELARFLMALDDSGDTLRRALRAVDMDSQNTTGDRDE